jgi:hypothetical protein
VEKIPKVGTEGKRELQKIDVDGWQTACTKLDVRCFWWIDFKPLIHIHNFGTCE